MYLKYKYFENTVGKGEQPTSPFPTVFPNHLDNFPRFQAKLKLSLANSNLRESNVVFHSPVLERCTVFWNTVLECLKGIFQQSSTVLL